MNVEIGTEAAQFPEKECINRIFVAVYDLVEYFFVYFFCFSGVYMQRRSMQLLPSSSDQPLVTDGDHHDLIAGLMTSMIIPSSPSLMCACDPEISACLMTFLILPSSSLNERLVMTFWFVV